MTASATLPSLLAWMNPKSKTLRFASQSLGRIYLSDPAVGERFFCEARGAVMLPEGKRARLKIHGNACHRLAELQTLPVDALYCLSVAGTQITDADLEPIAHLSELRSLCFEHTTLDGSGFSRLKALKNLRAITGWWSRFSDQSMQYLAQFPTLEHLDLSYTPVTDKGVPALKTLTNLRVLILAGTGLSNDAASALSTLPSMERFTF